MDESTQILLQLQRLGDKMEVTHSKLCSLEEAVCGDAGLKETVILLKDRESRRDHISKAAITASFAAVLGVITSHFRK